MRRCSQLISLLLFAAAFNGALAQRNLSFPFRHLSRHDGLADNQVFSIAQDTTGFIWLATQAGLQRYDGAKFLGYPEQMNTEGKGFIPGTEMYVDGKNVLWINNYSDIERLSLTDKKSSLQPIAVSNDDAVYKTADGKEWRYGGGRIYPYNNTSKEAVPPIIKILPPKLHCGSFAAEVAGSGDVWIASGHHLICLAKKTAAVYSEGFNPVNHPLLQPALFKASRFFRYVMADSRDNLWISTWDDVLYKYDNDTKKITLFSLAAITGKRPGKGTAPKTLVNCMMEDDHKMVWFGTEGGGLLRYDPAGSGFASCITGDVSAESVQYDFKIFGVFQDREESIWVATDKGISIFNPYRQAFIRLHHEEGNLASLPKSEIISFIQTTGGDVYVSTWGGGVTVYDSSFLFKRNILFTGNSDKNKVWCFLQVDNRTLWMGAQHGYLLAYDLISGNTRTLLPPGMQGSTIRCMQRDGAGNSWLGLHNGKIVGWNNANKNFVAYNSGVDSLPLPPVTGILFDNHNNCWASTTNGLKQFACVKNRYTATFLTGIQCESLEAFNDSLLLVTTLRKGLYFFNTHSHESTQLTTADGLPSATLHAVKKDAKQTVWFTTDFGIYRFNPAGKKRRFEDMTPGEIRSPLGSPRLDTLHNGMWLTCGTAEVIGFSARGPKVALPLKTELTGFFVFDRALSIDSIRRNNGLKLGHADNFFSIEFAALSYASPAQTKYSYQLTGVDKDWVDAGTKRAANYTDLNPGEYVFAVRAENGDNQGPVTSINITIRPPFWRTVPALCALAVGLILAVYGFIRSREANIKAAAAEKVKMQQLQADGLKNQLELEQVINFFSTSLIDKTTADDILWDVAKNLIGRLGFVDCMIYLWNGDKTRMIQKAGFGPKGSIEEMIKQPFDVVPGQGLVGYVLQTGEPVLIADTSADTRYRADEMIRLSEITVPLLYNGELIGVIDSEHHDKNFFTPQHLQIMTTIATLMANKIKSIEAEEILRQKELQVYSMQEQLSNARLEALRSQMNPHFIFNCINSIDALIHSNDKYGATVYLNKFAKLLRNILECSRRNVIPVAKDLETLKLYVELEQLRYENKFTTRYQVDETLIQGDYEVPPLLIQPFVENAILHGLKNRDGEEGQLLIVLRRADGCIQYRIKDNGIGRAAAGKFRQNKEGHYGMQISTDRVKLFNKEETPSVQVMDLYDDERPAGTLVTVNLKTG